MNGYSTRSTAFAWSAIGLLVIAMAWGQCIAQPQQTPDVEVPAAGIAQKSAVVQGFSEMLTTSKSGDAVWLFSMETGRGHKQTIPADQGRFAPTVGRGVVAFRTKTMMFACSSQNGSWDSVEIGKVPAQPTVGFNVVAFRAANTIYAFSSESGSWDSVELGDDVKGHPTVGANWALLETGSKIYAYSGKRGKWSVVDRDETD